MKFVRSDELSNKNIDTKRVDITFNFLCEILFDHVDNIELSSIV